jgi:hypothetical protein
LKNVIIHFLQHRPQISSFPCVLTLLGHDYYNPFYKPEIKPEVDKKEEASTTSTKITKSRQQRTRKKQKTQQTQQLGTTDLNQTQTTTTATTTTTTNENVVAQSIRQEEKEDSLTMTKNFEKLSLEERFVLLRKFSYNRRVGAKIPNVNKFNFCTSIISKKLHKKKIIVNLNVVSKIGSR